MRTILITGFGPFPGAPFNPTEALAAELAKRRSLGTVRRIAHVFRVSYAAVDRDLPVLLESERPDALIMFGLAGRTRHLRIEMRARNAFAVRLPDMDCRYPRGRTIVDGAPSELPLPIPWQRLLRAAQSAGVPSVLSRDAGAYVCNYLCWQAAHAARMGGPAITAFVHVPCVDRARWAHARHFRITQDDLMRAGEAMIRAIVPLLR